MTMENTLSNLIKDIEITKDENGIINIEIKFHDNQTDEECDIIKKFIIENIMQNKDILNATGECK